ncbi:uncharacterized protein Dwil_GK27089 [Drosophila willistoni]|uniref:Peptidase S1 domain-containing protein n=1 Tax=Drosophila willistoni TaxID=7260 RepID=A0A0Q9WZ80_DROWI|nr:uncharacterized protein Dwil_GK27089 [Drosophila willistoni]
MWSTNSVVPSLYLLLVICTAAEVIGIIGGRFAPLGMFPYHVSVHFDGMFDCGGSLISETFVLTAAHCVQHEKSRITIIGGIIDLREPNNGQTFDSKEIVIHPSFNYSTMDYDIALIRLSHPAVLNANVQVITMAAGNANYPPDTVALITGYGDIDPYRSRQNLLKYEIRLDDTVHAKEIPGAG